MRHKFANFLRNLADRISYQTAYVHAPLSFRIVRGKGLEVHKFTDLGIPGNINSGKYGTPLFYRVSDYKGIEDK